MTANEKSGFQISIRDLSQVSISPVVYFKAGAWVKICGQSPPRVLMNHPFLKIAFPKTPSRKGSNGPFIGSPMISLSLRCMGISIMHLSPPSFTTRMEPSGARRKMASMVNTSVSTRISSLEPGMESLTTAARFLTVNSS